MRGTWQFGCSNCKAKLIGFSVIQFETPGELGEVLESVLNTNNEFIKAHQCDRPTLCLYLIEDLSEKEGGGNER